MLEPGGRLIVAIIHPTVYAVVYPEADYFALTQYSEDYDFGEGTVWMTYWHRPLQDVINAFVEAGFGIKTVTEPPPAADTPAELLPNADGRSFICFLLRARSALSGGHYPRPRQWPSVHPSSDWRHAAQPQDRADTRGHHPASACLTRGPSSGRVRHELTAGCPRRLATAPT